MKAAGSGIHLIKDKMRKFCLVLHFALFSLLFYSCKSTKAEYYHALDDYRINEEITQEQLDSEDYVFIRFYDVVYDQPLRPGNYLRRPIRIFGKTPDGTVYNHTALSTYITDDSFVGLTLSKEKNMARYESVLDKKSNDFMVTNSEFKSRCAVVAIPCSKVDAENLKRTLDYVTAKGTKFTYGITYNLGVPPRHWKNKKKYEKYRNFPIEYAFDSVSLEDGEEEAFSKRTFVCSTFSAYILSKSVTRIRTNFRECNINPFGFTPVDLYYIDGAFELFNCRYIDYDQACDEFMAKYPGFRKYLRDYEGDEGDEDESLPGFNLAPNRFTKKRIVARH